MFSSEFYESFINSLFTEHLQKTEHSVVRFCLHCKEYMLRTSTLFQKSFACLRFALFHAPWRNTGSEKNYCNHRAPSWRFLSLSKFTLDPKWAQTGLRFHFGIKFHFGVRELHYQRSHDFGRNETHFGANFTSVKFQTAVSFPCKQ